MTTLYAMKSPELYMASPALYRLANAPDYGTTDMREAPWKWSWCNVAEMAHYLEVHSVYVWKHYCKDAEAEQFLHKHNGRLFFALISEGEILTMDKALDIGDSDIHARDWYARFFVPTGWAMPYFERNQGVRMWDRRAWQHERHAYDSVVPDPMEPLQLVFVNSTPPDADSVSPADVVAGIRSKCGNAPAPRSA